MRQRGLALELGAASAGDAYDRPPVPLDAAVLFAPVGDLVPVALAALDRGGTLAVAGIHLRDVPALDYQEHLFRGAHADQRHGQHARRRRGAAAAGRHAADPTATTEYAFAQRRRRSTTWRRAGSQARPS